MNLVDALAREPVVEALCARLSTTKSPLGANGLWGSCAPVLAAAIAGRLRRPLLYVAAHLEEADEVRDDLETVLGGGVELLPAWELLPGEGSGAGGIAAERARLCAEFPAAGEAPNRATERSGSGVPLRAVAASVQALMQPVPTRACLGAHRLTLEVGQRREPAEIAGFLLDHGFERLDQVEEPGDFAWRGGILDIFATADADPVRVEFFGDRIESIRHFEVGTQRSTRTVASVCLGLPPDPAQLSSSDTTCFSEYLPADTLVVLQEPIDIAETGRLVFERLGRPVGHFPAEAVQRNLARFGQLHLSRFPAASVPEADTCTVACAPLPQFESKAADAVAQVLQLAQVQPVVIFCDNQGEQDRLWELIAQEEGDARPDAGRDGSRRGIQSRVGLIHKGYIWQGSAPLAVVPHHELFHRYTQKRRLRRVPTGRPIESFLDLQNGDYVVHVVHGIAQYVGMRTLRKGDSGKSEEYLTLRFADDATMHVPVSQIDLVQKYVGARGVRPLRSKLGGTRWQSTKEKVQEAVSDLAAELLRIQAARQGETGIAYPADTRWQIEFENAFLYPETPDQTTANAEIKGDLMRPRPMDRLVCGDVGYGKTELAIRAAFKVAEFGKQVAVLVPTTVLADQHHRTFRERLADYPFVIECLNRFRTPRQQREIIAAARKGQIDILIGTHRLLSRDVGFADLGLVVVDEEQRFGVEHKERLKQLRATVDVLTLTATPIPRTLHMALVGLRDISSLATPPLDRRSIATRICAGSDELIREAILRELNREGQVYFVHNRVGPIETVANRIRALVPEAKVIVGHGQMPGDELEEVMLRFIRREADVLVCTTIIEAGVDIPNVNTIFIDRADRFGLADLHQLRGRVGRYKHRAFCYLLIDPGQPLTATAARRLKAIEEFSELGAGFHLAMRDLEIRGAGNLLGPEQSGHIAAVGYELYCQMLEKSVKRMRGEAYVERPAVHLELDVEAYIPRSYIPSDRQRMECYRRFAACGTPADVEQLRRDLEDAFGRIPEAVDTLLVLTEIKTRAAPWGIQTIIKKPPDLVFHIHTEIRKIEPLFEGSTGSVRVPDGRTLHWRLPDHYFYGTTLLRILSNLFRRAAPRAPAAEFAGPAGGPSPRPTAAAENDLAAPPAGSADARRWPVESDEPL